MNSAFDSGRLPDISEDIVINFVTYCQNVLHLRHDTIKLYLSGIRFHYIKANNVDILSNTLQLPYILKAIKRTQVNVTSGLRLPITFNVLIDLCNIISRGFQSPFIDIMLKCIYTLAFYGFMRCGEFTVNNNSTSYIQASDVEVASDLSQFTLLLRSSKTDPFGKGVPITIFNSPPLLPVTLMSTYLSYRSSQGITPHAPLFLEPNSKHQPLSRTTFINLLRSSLAAAGYNISQFSGHSFRIGACTTGAANGVPDHLLQTLGRWQSSCYTRYIHPKSSSIAKAQIQLSKALNIN